MIHLVASRLTDPKVQMALDNERQNSIVESCLNRQSRIGRLQYMPSTNTICFEGICRIYRNAVVHHIRNTFTSKFPSNWEEMVRTPFLKEWEEIRRNADIRRQTGELAGEIKDDADLLGVNHFYNLFEKYFDELFATEPEASDDVRKQQKQAILGWTRIVKNLRDPVIGHPTEVDVARQDAFTLLDSARRILNYIDHNASEEVAKLQEKVMSIESEPVDQVIEYQRQLEASTLPSRESIVQRFVGRRSEIQELNKWLKDPFSLVWLLAGDGGKGKSSIAYQFALETLEEPPEDLEIVIWLSAKARRLVSGQSVDVETPDFADLESALDWVLRAYGAPNIGDQGLKAKEEECRTYLAQLPALIVLDDVDSLEGRNLETVVSYFLYRTQAPKSKILLTSRRVPLGMQHTQVEGFALGSADGSTFIRSRLQLLGLDEQQFPTSVVNQILDACDGSPLFVEDLLRLCKIGEQPHAAIQKWKSEGGEAARKYALEREFEMLSEPARKALLACALYEGAASLPEIRAAAGLTAKICNDALSELQDLFLVPRPQLVQGTPRFALNSNTRRLVNEVLGTSDMATRVSSAIKSITGELQLTRAHRQQVGQFIRQAVTQVKLNEYTNAERTLLEALDLHPENPDLHGTLGWVYKSWAPQVRRADARQYFERAAELKAQKEDPYRHWWEMESELREWTSAAKAAERGLQVLKVSERLSYMAGFARSQSAKDLMQQAQYGRARQESIKAQTHLKKALLDPDKVEPGQYRFHSNVHRAVVLNYENQLRISQIQQDVKGERNSIQFLSRALMRWANEHPGDSNARSERQRLQYWFPELNSQTD